jgi:excinuclease UvrABC nuclease subunit
MYREPLPTDYVDETGERMCTPRHPDAIDDLESIKGKCGIYKLYDHELKLIYIGKSYKLGQRIVTSGRSRFASYYSYAIAETKTDTDIYELYYIGIEKPPFNTSSVHKDKPTVAMPELKFTEVKPIFKSVKISEQKKPLHLTE